MKLLQASFALTLIGVGVAYLARGIISLYHSLQPKPAVLRPTPQVLRVRVPSNLPPPDPATVQVFSHPEGLFG